MLTDHDLHELLSYQAQSPVLSVYLNTEPEAGNAEAHRLNLRSMLKEIQLTEDVKAVSEYFDYQHDWSGRSVVVFSCAPEKFFRAFSLAVPVRSRVRINDHPHVKPLADVLDSYGGYGVVLVDKQGGRLFSFHLGELREHEGVFGEVVHHTKRGGGSSFPGRRGGTAGQTENTAEVAERNMRGVVVAAVEFFAEKSVRRLLICGTEENVSKFRTMLPKAWQSLVVGSFNMAMTASHAEVFAKAMQVGHEAEIRREAQLAQLIHTEAAKGRLGALGLDNTLSAVREGRVQVLLLREGYRAPGYVCDRCGYITVQPLQTCPFCGGSFSQIADAVEMAVRQVMQAGGEVEVLHAEQEFVAGENIGALLRY